MKRSRKTLLSLLLVCSLSFFLTGCWDRREINDVAFAMVTGFDKTKDGKYKESLVIALPGKMAGGPGGGGGSGGENPFYVDSDVGINIREATQKMQGRMSRILNFSHRRVIVVGEEWAKSGLTPLFDVVTRVPQNRVTAMIVIADGEASKLIAGTPHMERFSGEAIREIVVTGFGEQPMLKDLAQKISLDGIDPVIPIFRLQPNKGEPKTEEIQASGAAIIRGDKMVEKVEGEEVNDLLWLSDQFKSHASQIMVEGKPVSITVRTGSRRLTVERLGERLVYRLKVSTEGGVFENIAGVDLFTPTKLAAVEEIWRKQLKSKLEKAVAKTQNLGSDIMGAGLILNLANPDEWRARQKDWAEHFSRAEFIIDVEAKIRRVGQISDNVAEPLKEKWR
ncbi:Ger(x)C family spore germination protein [Brevibacillus dissolubilis]|uniref:Ger(x)C family spore germination protein n=1 Tax=Brevibacillus dissolubilis TaxID=1844116 RepID=UPI001115D96E|nr:Ger(x)C family spore germination protein [Brevibacillus dissolubilis]